MTLINNPGIIIIKQSLRLCFSSLLFRILSKIGITDSVNSMNFLVNVWLTVDSHFYQHQIYAKVSSVLEFEWEWKDLCFSSLDGRGSSTEEKLSLHNQNINGLSQYFEEEILLRKGQCCENLQLFVRSGFKKRRRTKKKLVVWARSFRMSMRGKNEMWKINQEEIKIVKMTDGQNTTENFIHGKANVHISIHLWIWQQ